MKNIARIIMAFLGMYLSWALAKQCSLEQEKFLGLWYGTVSLISFIAALAQIATLDIDYLGGKK